jgi:predicted RNase H-like nuclease (RuvC/YqgF family)
VPETTRSRSEQPRSSRAWRLVLVAGCPALLAVAFFALPSATGNAKPPSASGAPRSEALTESIVDDEAKSPVVATSEAAAVQTTKDDPDGVDDDAEEEDEEPTRLEARLSAEIRLLENRRRAHDRLEASASSDRLSASDRAALDARRAVLAEKLAVHEQRVERLKQELGNDESGYEAQNGIP